VCAFLSGVDMFVERVPFRVTTMVYGGVLLCMSERKFCDTTPSHALQRGT
jgi:hypothetical protein